MTRRTSLAAIALVMATSALPDAAAAQERGAIRPYAPGTPPFGIGGTPSDPATAVLIQDEDWGWLLGMPLRNREVRDRLRYVPLSADGTVSASFAFLARLGLEHFDDEGFGANPGSDGSTHLRANVYGGLSFGDRFRLFGALKFGQVEDKRFPVPPAEDDGPDLHQSFAEIGFGDALGRPVRDAFVRVGRQELHYGAGRLISIRNGPNVRSDFDGALVRARIGATVADAFVMLPSEDNPGAWNNHPDESQAVWGVYTSTPVAAFGAGAGVLGDANLDLYYIGHRRDVSPYAFQQTPLDEERHTFGARLWTTGPTTDGLNLDLEAAFQLGTAEGVAGIGTADIRAGFVAGTASYGFADAPWTPVLGLRFGLSSGDGDPSDDRLGTFRAPFPPGRYFGESNPLGPGNLGGAAVSLTVSPIETVSLAGRVEGFWRVEAEDGIYAPPQVPLRGGAGDARYVGHEVALIGVWTIRPGTTLTGTLSRFDTGAYLRANPPARDIGYAALTLDTRF